jgi:hypothetical protein
LSLCVFVPLNMTQTHPFSFVMEARGWAGEDPNRLAMGDAFVIPPGMATLSDPTDDELLEVTLGTFPDHFGFGLLRRAAQSAQTKDLPCPA